MEHPVLHFTPIFTIPTAFRGVRAPQRALAGGRGVRAGRGRAGGGGGGHRAQEDGRADRLRHRRAEQDVHVSRTTGGCVNCASDVGRGIHATYMRTFSVCVV